MKEFMDVSKSTLFFELLNQLPFSRNELESLIITAPYRYKDHTILKRNGRGTRVISQPTAELKVLQSLLIKNFLHNLPLHEAATAYCKGKSILDHAQPHVNSRYILKLDFENFFPSITSSAIKFILARETSYSEMDIDLAIKILCKVDQDSELSRLSIGAPSSPFISNCIMFDFDKKITSICRNKSAVYTRYADDIAISTKEPNLLTELKNDVISTLQETSYLSLSLNNSKTVNISKKNRRNLVGLTISNDGCVTIGHENKRILRVKMHKMSLGLLSLEEVDHLKGLLSFARSVQPIFVDKLIEAYNYRKIADINKTMQSR